MVAKTLIRHSILGQGPDVVLMHGLFGTGSNLGALARALADRYRVFSLDLPDHGRSAWLDTLSLQRLAEAVQDWMAQQRLGHAALVGHSLGGKVGMELSLAAPERVSALVVADIAPVDYPPHHDAVFAALEAVAQGKCRSRAEAAQLMSWHLEEEGVVQFLLMSLARGDDGYYCWRFNLEGIKRSYGALRTAPASGRRFNGPVMFVKGGDSDYVLPEHRSEVLSRFPAAQMKVMPGCGHWLHAQQPNLFNGIARRFLDAALSGA